MPILHSTDNSSKREILPSIHLGMDLDDSLSLLDGFYLSNKGITVIQTVLDSLASENKRKRMGAITAPPGSGKSYLALFLATILQNKSEWQSSIRDILKEQNSNYVKKILPSIEKFELEGKKFLPVAMVGQSDSLRKFIIESILISLRRSNPSDSMEAEWILLFKDMEGAPARNRNPEHLPARIGEFLSHPDIFWEGYERILDHLHVLGYDGIIFFHDEFNRFLSAQGVTSHSNDLDFLQDFAERNLRLKKYTVMHYLLLHKGISQYLGGISEERRKEWLKIEGRFHPIHYQEDTIDTFSLFLSHFKKSRSANFSQTETSSAKEDCKLAKKANPNIKEIFNGMEEDLALEGYPLHLPTIISFPFLCSILGQNERSLFTEISDLIRRDRIEFVTFDSLYDLFDGKVDSLNSDDSLRSKWNAGRHTISELSDPNEIRVAKILTLISVIGKNNLLPGSLEWIAYSSRLDKKKTKEILHNLVGKNLAIFRETSKQYQIYYGSSIQVGAKITSRSSHVTIEDIQRILEKQFPLSPSYCREFNAIHYTSRFFSKAYILESKILEELKFINENADPSQWESKIAIDSIAEILNEIYSFHKKQGASGIVFYYLGERNSFLAKILEKTIIQHERCSGFLLIQPEQSFTELSYIKKYASALQLQKDSEFLKSDPMIETDLKVHLSDLQEKIHLSLTSLFHEGKYKIVLPSIYQEMLTQHEEDLISNIMKQKYSESPKINSELINRETITPPIRNARKKILREMLSGSPDLGTQNNGYGPDVAIFRSLFTAKNLIHKTKDGWKLDFKKPTDVYGNPDLGFAKAIGTVKKYLNRKKEIHSISEIYDILLSPPHGFYSETIPFYLLGILLEGKYSFSLYHDGRFEKDLNSDVLEKIHLDPDQFTIRILEKNPIYDLYLQNIIDTFNLDSSTQNWEESENDKKISDNKIYRATLSLLYWYNRLPEYSKRSKNHTPIEREFLDTIAHASDPEIFLLEKIPKIFQIKLSETNESNIQFFISKLNQTKDQIESHYTDLIQQIEKETHKIISPHTQDSSTHLLELILDFRSTNSYKLEILKKQDKDFLKLHDRLVMPYEKSQDLIESIASLLTDSHPKFWKDSSLSEYSFKLTRELSKLHIASIIAGESHSSNYIKISHIVQEANSWAQEEREFLIQELMKGR
ncbi:MAG: hypothetical protein JJT78_04095 [Leptospira sp.]|nr:hypothetical protein [Leptospira sp.]